MTILTTGRVFAALTLGALLLPLSLLAQFDIPIVPGDLSLSVTPAAPSAGERVSARVGSYSENLTRAEIRWTLNGETLDSGVGVVATSFIVGGVGSSNILQVSATLPGGKILTASATIRPGGLDLLWQAGVYAPPFYRGKAFAPYDASITLLAMPFFVESDGSRINPAALSYTWHFNGQVLGDSSGRGAQTLTLPGPRVYRGIDVSVDVASSDGTIKATRSLFFGGEQPFVLFYENDPLLGFRFEHSLPESVTLTRTEATISAFPYFFSTGTRDGGGLSYVWTLNDNVVMPSSKNQADLVLRQTGPSSGTANIGLSIQNLVQIFQAASQDIQITFGSQ